jgi:hypothetical protein
MPVCVKCHGLFLSFRLGVILGPSAAAWDLEPTGHEQSHGRGGCLRLRLGKGRVCVCLVFILRSPGQQARHRSLS